MLPWLFLQLPNQSPLSRQYHEARSTILGAVPDSEVLCPRIFDRNVILINNMTWGNFDNQNNRLIKARGLSEKGK